MAKQTISPIRPWHYTDSDSTAVNNTYLVGPDTALVLSRALHIARECIELQWPSAGADEKNEIELWLIRYRREIDQLRAAFPEVL